MKRLTVIYLFIATTAVAQNDPYIVSIDPSDVQRGARVNIALAHAHHPISEATVLLQSPATKVGDAPKVEPVDAEPAGTSGANYVYYFVVPGYLPYGEYNVYFRYKGGDGVARRLRAAPGERFRVSPKAPPRLTSAYPSVGYLKGGTFSVTVVGENFSSRPTDHVLVLNGRAIPTCSGEVRPPCATPEWRVPGRALRFSGIPKDTEGELLRGEQKVRVVVDGQSSQEDVAVMFTHAKQGTPGWWAVIAATLALGVIALPAFAAGRQQNWLGRTHSALRSIFLDPQTNTYSLSKFQFYLWTIAAVFGYVFLTAAWTLVQGKFELPPIPDGLPGILLVSIGTGTIAIGLNATKTKGSGDAQPSFADFFTTGGVVVPERAQFFLWTILGVGAFMWMIWKSDPGTIAGLPKIPEGFLYLMGISSAGYLGGKLARQPGPIVTSASAKLGSLIIDIHGRNLATDATILIGERTVRKEWLFTATGEEAAEVIQFDDDRRYARQLRLTIKTQDESAGMIHLPDGSVLAIAASGASVPSVALTVINPDGQHASVAIAVQPRVAPSASSISIPVSPIAPSPSSAP